MAQTLSDDQAAVSWNDTIDPRLVLSIWRWIQLRIFDREHRGLSASTTHNVLSDTENIEDGVAVEYTHNGNERNFNLNAMQVSIVQVTSW